MNTEEIFQQVINENCKDPLHRFAELVRQDEREQWDSSDMAHRPNGLTVEQAEKQEPVAAVELITIGSEQVIAVAWHDSNAFKIGIKLYTAPPKREWVGLSDSEAEIYANQFNGIRLVKGIEALLKRRNT